MRFAFCLVITGCWLMSFNATWVVFGSGRANAVEPTSAPEIGRILLHGDTSERSQMIRQIEQDQRTEMTGALITLLRFMSVEQPLLASALETLTGEQHGADWHQWMLWQEENTQVPSFDGFDAWKSDLMALIDPNFRKFLYDGVAHSIRLEEITWGGVIKDGIPALVNPPMIDADRAQFMTETELVFGVAINGDIRAYPLRFLDWHEMANDVVGGVPVALAYCTLCGSGILFDTRVEGRAAPFAFGSSGFLYRSNKLMYDQATHSLWNQFTGEPVVGTLIGSGIQLDVLPVVITSWADWKARHPETKTIALETGFDRDYTPGRPYAAYFASPELMFPARVEDSSLAPKDYVFALRLGDTDKAWRLSDFSEMPVHHDEIDGRQIVLIGDASTRSVRAYESDGLQFVMEGDGTLIANGLNVELTESAILVGDDRRLERLPGHIAYWFAFQNYLPKAPKGF